MFQLRLEVINLAPNVVLLFLHPNNITHVITYVHRKQKLQKPSSYRSDLLAFGARECVDLLAHLVDGVLVLLAQ